MSKGQDVFLDFLTLEDRIVQCVIPHSAKEFALGLRNVGFLSVSNGLICNLRVQKYVVVRPNVTLYM
jgi:hypothetical protein